MSRLQYDRSVHADVDRHWDTWLTDKKNAVFAGTLAGGDQYSFDGNMTNLMVGLQNVTRAETPVMPDADTADYEISPDGEMVAFPYEEHRLASGELHE